MRLRSRRIRKRRKREEGDTLLVNFHEQAGVWWPTAEIGQHAGAIKPPFPLGSWATKWPGRSRGASGSEVEVLLLVARPLLRSGAISDKMRPSTY